MTSAPAVSSSPGGALVSERALSTPRGAALGRWVITIAATITSTLALDAVATMAGVSLTATNVLAAAPIGGVLAFLAGTYVLWGVALGRTVKANWRLLEATGTSTNVLSKFLYDVARLRSRGSRARQLAAAVGYVATELAKEAPFYAGAFGSALVIDGVDGADAIVFLGGANLGGAVFELGLAWLTHAHVARRSRRAAAASFDTDWVPHDYLNDYYRTVEPDEVATIAFFVEALQSADVDQPVLVFGVGPTLHHVFLTAPIASEIHLAEYLPSNLAEIERWVKRDPAAHDWHPFVEYTLRCEGANRPRADQVHEREDLTRARITKLLACDARLSDPLDARGNGSYSTVISAYCADSATSDLSAWERYLRHIAGLVAPGGLFVTAALRHSTGYLVGERRFPSACVDEADVRRVLADDFDWDDGVVEVCDLSAHDSHGYAGVILASVRKRPARCREGAPATVTSMELVA